MEQTLQIGIFGDSISKGIVLDAETHRYSSLKKEITEWISPSTALHNFSVMGSTIQKGLSIITRHTDQLASYQNVFLEFGGNDCDFDWSAVSERPQAHHEPHTPLKQFEALYTKAIQLIQEKKGNSKRNGIFNGFLATCIQTTFCTGWAVWIRFTAGRKCIT